MIALPAKNVSSNQNYSDRLGRKSFIMYKNLGRKQKVAGSLCGIQFDRQLRQEAELGGLVGTL